MSRASLQCTLTIRLCALLLLVAAASLSPAYSSAAQGGKFVSVSGSDLLYEGQTLRLKGSSFYPSGQPWNRMWSRWDGEMTKHDLARFSDFGSNTVRVLVAYRPDQYWTNDNGAVNAEYLNQLQQLVQLAGEMDLKVLISLFDWYDDNPPADSPDWAKNRRYLADIVGTFADDDRVLGWDLHNEPDHYDTWNANPDRVIDWLTRVAAEVKRLAPQQLITVGVGKAPSLWQPDAAGRTLLDISDFASFHSYDAGAIDAEIAGIRSRTGKPIVLEETGWPTGPCGTVPDYNEAHQVVLYTLMLAAAEREGLSGFLQWTLWDFTPTLSAGGGVENEQDHFGLIKRDGSLKPAATLFRDRFTLGVVPLPSDSTSNLPLTAQPVPEPGVQTETYTPPLPFPQTGVSVWNQFQAYWKTFGGLEIYGYPITEARVENGLRVQYFERARFEYHPEVQRTVPDWLGLDYKQKLRLVVQLTRYGADIATERDFAPGGAAEAAAAGATWYDATGHSLRGSFRDYWQAHEGLINFGLPLSEEFAETSPTDGKTYTVQYFERARLELHPENAGTPYEIQLGQLGSQALRAKGC